MESPFTAAARARIRIRIKGTDYRMVDQSSLDIVGTVSRTGARVSGPLPLPAEVLSPRTSLTDEIRNHRRLIEVLEPNAQTISTMRQLNLPAGIEINIILPDLPVVEIPGEVPAKPHRRHDSRVAAIQFLYTWEVQRQPDRVTALFDFFSHQIKGRDYYAFAEELIHGVIQDVALIDEVIGKYAKNWAFNRIARVDLAILRVAIFELMRRTDIPPVVSINEAVDIAKEFSTEESKRFVNGILDSYKEELGRDPRKAEAN